MNAKSQPERIWFWVAPLLVWFSTAYSAPLITHLYFVLFQRDALKDGQYAMIFPFGAGLGFVAGTIPLVLTIILSHRKPKFAPIAPWVALGYIAFWTIVVTACEAIVLRKGVGFGVLMTFMTFWLLPEAVPFIWLSVMIAPLHALSFSLIPVVLLLVAFYFTPPRGWN